MSKDNTEGLDLEKEVGTIPFESVINIQVSGFFYGRIIALLTAFGNNHGIDVIKMTEELKTREPINNDEYNFITLISLCSEIEAKAQAQGIMVNKPLKEFMTAMENDPES